MFCAVGRVTFENGLDILYAPVFMCVMIVIGLIMIMMLVIPNDHWSS